MLPIKFRVFGTGPNLPFEIELTSRSYYQNETFTSVLPLLIRVRFEISDSTDEILNVIQNITMTSTNNPYVQIEGLDQNSALDLIILQGYQIYQLDQAPNRQNIISNKLYSLYYMSNITGSYNSSNDNVTVNNT